MAATEETVARLRKAVRTKNAAEKRADDARAALAIAMAEAIREGMRQSEVVAETGYTREHVRRLVREAEQADLVVKGPGGKPMRVEIKGFRGLPPKS